MANESISRPSTVKFQWLTNPPRRFWTERMQNNQANRGYRRQNPPKRTHFINNGLLHLLSVSMLQHSLSFFSVVVVVVLLCLFVCFVFLSYSFLPLVIFPLTGCIMMRHNTLRGSETFIQISTAQFPTWFSVSGRKHAETKNNFSCNRCSNRKIKSCRSVSCKPFNWNGQKRYLSWPPYTTDDNNGESNQNNLNRMSSEIRHNSGDY